MKYANEYAKIRLAFLNFGAHGTEVFGQDLNQHLKYPGWDALSHRGWRLWNILKEMVRVGLVEHTVSGRGRKGKYKLI